MRVSRVPLLLLLAAAAAAAAVVLPTAPKSTLLSPAPAGYPVPFLVNGSLAYATAESAQGATRRIVLLRRAPSGPSPAGPWEFVSVVVEDATAGVDLANGFCRQLPVDGAAPGFDGSIVCAYRHHVPADGGGTLYRIRAVRSADGGLTWSAPVNVTQGPVGVWEPHLYVSTAPAAAGAAARPVLRVLISSELTNGGEQDITQQDSLDGGASWGGVSARVHTPGSRNGMAGVAVLADGSLLMVMEGFWSAAGWGAFTVGSVRSFDGGASWAQPTLVHAPPTGCDAGAPKVGTCALTGKVNAVFMSNAPPAGGACAPGARGGWPGNAGLALKAAFLAPGNASAPLDWSASPVATVPTATPTVLWPAVLFDVVGVGEAAAGGEADSMRVAYLGSDGAAYLTDGTLCLD